MGAFTASIRRGRPAQGFFNVEVESGGGPVHPRPLAQPGSATSPTPIANTNASSYRGIFDLSDLEPGHLPSMTTGLPTFFSPATTATLAAIWAGRELPIQIRRLGRVDPEGVWKLSPVRVRRVRKPLAEIRGPPRTVVRRVGRLFSRPLVWTRRGVTSSALAPEVAS